MAMRTIRHSLDGSRSQALTTLIEYVNFDIEITKIIMMMMMMMMSSRRCALSCTFIIMLFIVIFCFATVL